MLGHADLFRSLKNQFAAEIFRSCGAAYVRRGGALLDLPYHDKEARVWKDSIVGANLAYMSYDVSKSIRFTIDANDAPRSSCI